MFQTQKIKNLRDFAVDSPEPFASKKVDKYDIDITDSQSIVT